LAPTIGACMIQAEENIAMNIIRQTRSGIEVLNWLQAVLVLAHESRRSIDAASNALRSGEVRTFYSLFVSELHTMRTIVDRFVQAGHFEKVATAGAFCSFRATALAHGVGGVGFTSTGHETDELFIAIEQSTNSEELEEIAEYIEAEFANDFAYDDDDEDDGYDIAA
jgi:hypothetical protein